MYIYNICIAQSVRGWGGCRIYSVTRISRDALQAKKKIRNSRNIIMGRPSKQSHLFRAANGGQPRKGLYSMFICTQRRLFVKFSVMSNPCSMCLFTVVYSFIRFTSDGSILYRNQWRNLSVGVCTSTYSCELGDNQNQC